jgi:hypothetical protein
MFRPVADTVNEIQLNQCLDDVLGARRGHITGPELPNCGANNAMNG